MEIKQTNVTEAHELMTKDPDVVYLDVRTAREFEQGHPPGAFNVPIVFMQPGTPAQPNGDFLDIVRRHIPPASRVLVGCQSGVRSQRAAELLAGAGFADITNVQGGFGGAKDRLGTVVAVGWKDAGCPVETGQPSGRAYDDLKTRNGK